MIPSSIENTGDALKGGAIGAGAGAIAQEATNGLSVAASAAGDVLRGIFGGLPWNMDASSIVDAVSPGVLDASTVVVDSVPRVMGVVG